MKKNAPLCQIGCSILNLIVREDSWNTCACCGPIYVYFLSLPNNLIVHAITTTYMVNIDYATKLGCFPITCFANRSVRKCHLPFMDYANRINHSQYHFFWDDMVCWLISSSSWWKLVLQTLMQKLPLEVGWPIQWDHIQRFKLWFLCFIDYWLNKVPKMRTSFRWIVAIRFGKWLLHKQHHNNFSST